MKEKVKNFLSKDGRSIILLIFILHFILMFFITPNRYDDKVFIDWITVRSIPELVAERYQAWTSRVIIEFTLFTVLKTSKYLWMLIESGMVALLAYSISRIFIKKENKKQLNIFLLFLIMAYPMDIMGSAGWAATTVNYMWPLATAMFSLIPIKKIWDGEKFKVWEYPIYVLATIFACNQEQACAMLFGVYLLFTILLLLRDKKIHPFIILELILTITSLIFILTAPGNYVRKNEEIINYFKDFEMLTVQDKLSIGFTVTLGDIIEENYTAFLILSIMLVAYIFVNYKEKIYRTVSLIPLITICGLSVFSGITYNLFPFLGSLRERLILERPLLTAGNANNLFYVFPLILSMVVFFSIIICLLLIFKNMKSNIAVLVFTVGLATRLIMGFSPSVFASSVRTIFFFDISMLIVSLLIWQEFIKKKDKYEKKIQNRIYFIIKLIGIMQYINVLATILITQK